MDNLQQEAWDLHHRLYKALLAEENKRNATGHLIGDKQRVGRNQTAVLMNHARQIASMWVRS